MQHQSTVKEFSFEASEFSWDIAPGKTIQAWGFNRQVPGPELRVKKGDTVVVKLHNKLGASTMIHWHGVRLDAAMDGTDAVQQAIEPGETFEYRFKVPDAGTFWYHSHANETVQMERGMYGSLIVEDDQDPAVDADRVLMIDDMKLNADYSFTQPSGFFGRVKERHDGREGDTLLINGKEQPVISMHAGQVERWRFINSSSARYFLLHMEGKPFTIIATDGGLIEQPFTTDKLLITPGERYDVLAGPYHEGEVFSIESLPYNRMTFLKPVRQQFATVRVGAELPSAASLPASLRTIEQVAHRDAKINRTVKLSVGPSLKNGMNFLINNKTHINDKPVRVGELQVWEINNASLMDHPFHLHGFFFQVLEVNGVTPAYRAWKDTVNVGPRTKIKIAWMPDNRPGTWMYHCHIIEHHAAGMMGHFSVTNGEAMPMPRSHHHHV